MIIVSPFCLYLINYVALPLIDRRLEVARWPGEGEFW